MDMLATPLGEWARVREETTGSVFLVGKFLQMPVSVALESADVERVDFNFIQDKVSKFAHIKRQTELFFERIAKSKPTRSSVPFQPAINARPIALYQHRTASPSVQYNTLY